MDTEGQPKSLRNLSILSYMELIPCAKDKNQVRTIGKLVRDYSLNVLPLTDILIMKKKHCPNHWKMTNGYRILRKMKRKHIWNLHAIA
jgi:hypothetical protein